MAHVLRHVEVVALLRAVLVNLVHLAEELLARADELRGRKAEAVGALHLLHDGLHGSGVLAWFGQDDEHEGVHRFAEQIGGILASCIDEGAGGFLAQFAQAGVEHGRSHLRHVFIAEEGHRAAQLHGHGLVFEHHLYGVLLLLLVLVDDVDGLVVGRHGIGFVGSGVLRHLDGAEDALHGSFHLVDVDVAHHDDALQVGAVPFFIIGAQGLGLEVIDHLHQADGVAVAVLGAGIERGQVALEDASRGFGAQAPLFVDDTAFFVDFFRVEREAVGPVVQDEQARVDVLGRHGHVVDVVHRLVGRCVGVQIDTELDSDAFAVLDEAVAGKVVGAVEAHVFQEVGQAALRVVLLYGAHLLRDVEVGPVFRQGVVADVVGQSVGQLAVADGRVHRYLRHLGHLLRRRAQRGHQGQRNEQQQRFAFFHTLCFLGWIWFVFSFLLPFVVERALRGVATPRTGAAPSPQRLTIVLFSGAQSRKST